MAISKTVKQGGVSAQVAPGVQGVQEQFAAGKRAFPDSQEAGVELDVFKLEADNFGTSESSVAAEEHEGAFSGGGVGQQPLNFGGRISAAVVLRAVEGASGCVEGIDGDESLLNENVVEGANL